MLCFFSKHRSKLSISSKKYFPNYLESVTNDKISQPASTIQPSCPNCHLFKCRFAKRHSRRRWLIIHVNRSLKRGRHRQRQMNERKTFIQNTSNSRVSSELIIHSKNKYFSGESFRDSNSWRLTSNDVWFCFSHSLLLIRTHSHLGKTHFFLRKKLPVYSPSSRFFQVRRLDLEQNGVFKNKFDWNVW